MPIEFTDVAFLLTVLTLLSGGVSVVTEVIKLNTNKLNPITVSTVAGLIITIGATICYCMVKSIAITFPILFMAFCASWVVILTANMGFDKVKQYFVGIKAMKEEKGIEVPE